MQKNKYQPEIGHIIFYNSNILNYDCPEYVIALLKDIQRKLDTIMWNKYHKEFDNPFDNSGNVEGFKNKVFEVHAFDWNETNNQPFNFKYKDIEISWYKYLGRDTSINKLITPEEAIQMYECCIGSIKEKRRFA